LKYRVEESKQAEITLVGKADLFQQYDHEGGMEEGPLRLKSDAMLLLPLAKD
jgi:hypothetical protein